MMPQQPKTKFTVSQIAGSLRMEGIIVSTQDETVISAIIEGKLDATQARKRLVEHYKKTNTKPPSTLKPIFLWPKK